jgi:hypothetical protein
MVMVMKMMMKLVVVVVVEMMNVNEILEYNHQLKGQKLEKLVLIKYSIETRFLPFELRSSVLNESILSSRSCSTIECVL